MFTLVMVRNTLSVFVCVLSVYSDVQCVVDGRVI